MSNPEVYASGSALLGPKLRYVVVQLFLPGYTRQFLEGRVRIHLDLYRIPVPSTGLTNILGRKREQKRGRKKRKKEEEGRGGMGRERKGCREGETEGEREEEVAGLEPRCVLLHIPDMSPPTPHPQYRWCRPKGSLGGHLPSLWCSHHSV